jgi:hypothetical protein
VNIKDKVPSMPHCPTCRATMDLKVWSLLEAGILAMMDILYYCNNPSIHLRKRSEKREY